MATKKTAKKATAKADPKLLIANDLLADQSEFDVVLEKRADRYLRHVCTMLDNNISVDAMRETFREMPKSDWPLNENGNYVGEMMATKESKFARAFNSFRSSVCQKFETEKIEGEVMFVEGKGGSPVLSPKKESSTRAPRQTDSKDDKSDKGKTISGTGAELWDYTFKDITEHAAKLRAGMTGKTREQRKMILASVEMINDMIKDIDAELIELGLK